MCEPCSSFVIFDQAAASPLAQWISAAIVQAAERRTRERIRLLTKRRVAKAILLQTTTSGGCGFESRRGNLFLPPPDSPGRHVQGMQRGIVCYGTRTNLEVCLEDCFYFTRAYYAAWSATKAHATTNSYTEYLEVATYTDLTLGTRSLRLQRARLV